MQLIDGGLRGTIERNADSQFAGKRNSGFFQRTDFVDGELGIVAAGLGLGIIRLVHFAFVSIGGGQIIVDEKWTITRVGRIVVFADSGVEMPETKFRIARVYMEHTD